MDVRGHSTGRLYIKDLGTKLSAANRYMRNPEARERTVIRSVATSSAIEGIEVPFGHGAKTGASNKVHLKRKRPMPQCYDLKLIHRC